MKSLKHLQPLNWDIELNKITYDAEINRKQPSALIFMVDQSGSMGWNEQEYNGEIKKYSQIVSDIVNELLDELISRCTKQEGIRDYFDVCVLGYGGVDNHSAYPLWEGNLKGNDWVSISELKSNAKYKTTTKVRTIRGKVKTVSRSTPFWFSPVSEKGTPMGAAFNKANELLTEWIQSGNNKESFPPIVMNITDGAQTDYTNEELLESALRLKALNTNDGNVLVLNCHLSTNNNDSSLFPYSSNELPKNNNYAQRLFEMSSVMPQNFELEISNFRQDNDAFSGYKGMVFNADTKAILKLLTIGTLGPTVHINRK